MRVTIDRLGHLGDGIALGADGPIFVAGGLPGEVIEGRADGDKLLETKIITPSTDRVKPPCPHAKTCGGCALQHASDQFVAQWKIDVVRLALEGQGLAAPFRPILTSPSATRRRATVSARRTKGGALIGFHARASDTVISVPDCRLLHPDLMAAFPGIEALVKAGGSRSSEISASITGSIGGVDVVITGGKPLDGQLRLDLARIVEAHRMSRLTWDGETVALRDQPVHRFGAAKVVAPPGAFLQATLDGEAALQQTVRAALGSQRRVFDLFAGLGTFTLPLAADTEVHAVEGDPAMTAALERGARQAVGLKKTTVETRDLFRRPLEPQELSGASGVVIDPPRAGAEAQMRNIAKAAVPVVVAVSCNPVTFARDARILTEAGYVLDWIQVVDQFRWSTHVEMVARLSMAK